MCPQKPALPVSQGSLSQDNHQVHMQSKAELWLREPATPVEEGMQLGVGHRPFFISHIFCHKAFHQTE